MNKLLIFSLATLMCASLCAADFGKSLENAMDKTTKDEEQRQKRQDMVKTKDKLLDQEIKEYDPFKAKKAPARPLPEFVQRGINEAIDKKLAEYDKNLEKKIEAIVAKKLKEAQK